MTGAHDWSDVRHMVADIEAQVVQDYRNLHARESPYRFRGLIIETGERLLEDETALHAIAEGWKLGGIARDGAAVRDSIITDLRDTGAEKMIVKAIVAMAHSLDLHVIAEGVETEMQRRIVMELGCNEMQGFVFSKPLPASEIEALLD